MYGQWGQGYPGVDPAQQMYWQQYYAAAGYSQPQQFYGAYGAPVPGMPTTANAAPATTTVTTPIPPAEPPKEERPPLPAEPPPDDEVIQHTCAYHNPTQGCHETPHRPHQP